MDETNHKQPSYSSERTVTAAIDAPPQPPPTADFSPKEKRQPSSIPALKTQLAAWLEIASARCYLSLREFPAFLKRTTRVWLIATAALFGLLTLVTLVQRVSAWARDARERRQEQAIAAVTPDRLIARCGQAAEDVTKEVYPILLRTMRYQPRTNQRLVLAFSRTAEENSDWVFLSMKDETGTTSYDTPEAKIAALSCLDSNK